MTYCEINDVKKVLKLPLTKTSNDSELRRCLDDATGLVDGLLSAQGLMVPTVVPRIIVDSVKFFAAWEFQHKRKLVNADVFWQEADRLLCSYTEQFCSVGVSF